MLSNDALVEVTIACAQIVATAAIAYGTFMAASHRYKKERSWDRRLDCYSSLMSTLVEVQNAVGQWIDWIDGEPFRDRTKVRQSFESVRARCEAECAVGYLLLPDDLHPSLDELLVAFDKTGRAVDGREFKQLNETWARIESARAELIKIGRATLAA